MTDLGDEADAYQCHSCGKECNNPEKLDLGQRTIHLRADVCPGGSCRRLFIAGLMANEQLNLKCRQEIAKKYPEDALSLVGAEVREEIAADQNNGPRPLLGSHVHSPPPPESYMQNTPERQNIGRPSVFSRLKTALTPENYVVDFARLANDIKVRVDWYQERMSQSEAEIRESGDRIMEMAIRRVVELGFVDAAVAQDKFTKVWQEAMKDEGVSQDSMIHDNTPPVAPKKPTWNDIEFANQLAKLIRRSLDGRLTFPANKGRMALDVRRVIQDVIDVRGEPAYQFMLIFPVDARKK